MIRTAGFWLHSRTFFKRHVSTYINTDLDQPVVSHLVSRGLIATISSDDLEKVVSKKKVSLYCGADPTAKSLHVGNMIPLIVLLHFYLRGHNPLALVGGATGEVGDPSGRSSERQKMEQNTRQNNIKSIQAQMLQFFERGKIYANSKGYGMQESGNAQFVNNATWWKGVGMLDFLATYGRHIRVGAMIARDSVKNRLSSERGLGFNEFTYQVLQAYDFWHLYKSENCLIQVGGNDQWGNITAGIDLISRLKSSIGREEDAYGLTVPLLTTPTGEKFGKSAGNAVWLDTNLTKPYHLYQYFIKSPDEAVEKYLKLFTLIPLTEIQTIMEKHRLQPEDRLAQKILATEVTDLVHGIGSGKRAEIISCVLFPSSGQHYSTDSKEILTALNEEGLLLQYPRHEIIDQPWRNIISTVSGKSKSEATRLIRSNGIYYGLNRKLVVEGPVTDAHVEHDLLLIRLGKSNYYAIKLN